MKKMTYTSTFIKTFHEDDITDFIEYCIVRDKLDENETIKEVDDTFERWVNIYFEEDIEDLAVIFDNYDAILEDVKEELEHRGYIVGD